MSTSSQSAAKASFENAAGGPARRTSPIGVMVVDDNDMICDIVSMGLSAAGYEVSTAKSGEEALEIFKSSPDKYQVLIVDDYMPGGMTGNEFVYHIRALAPAAKVILTSGYFLSNQTPENGDETVVRLEKPFRVEQIVNLVGGSLG